ncbi:MAG: hypothetical protein A4E45_00132 [Methanosaeta sp. PtaB.Bin039]|nr:MAG: hypothetical protein A4E45_00132 [Methanosaeta sp. PtaB.Bin039]
MSRDHPYDLEVPGDERKIASGLMRLSQQALSKYVDKEPDLYCAQSKIGVILSPLTDLSHFNRRPSFISSRGQI